MTLKLEYNSIDGSQIFVVSSVTFVGLTFTLLMCSWNRIKKKSASMIDAEAGKGKLEVKVKGQSSKRPSPSLITFNTKRKSSASKAAIISGSNQSIRGKRKRKKAKSNVFKLAPLTVPEESSPFLKLYAERYYTLIKRDPKCVKNSYNTVCFLILSMLESKLSDEKIFRFLDYFTPITDVKTHMDSFDDDFCMAIQRHRDLATILDYWQLGALRRYEILKWYLITNRKAELFLFFHRDQSIGYAYYFNRILDNSYRGARTQLFMGTGFNKASFKSNRDSVAPDIKVSLYIDNVVSELPLDEAMAIVTAEKRKIETQIENFSLYLRCIRELIRINQTNMTKIYSYQFRWRPTRLSERVQSGRINMNPPMSALRQAFLDSNPR